MSYLKTIPCLSRQLEMVQNNYANDLDCLADSIRTDILIPFCREYGATYHAGNGTFFITQGGHSFDAIDATLPEDHYLDGRLKGKFGADLRAVMALLSTDIAPNDCLGYRVCDVSKADLK